MMATTKQCRDCGLAKPLEEFNRNSNGSLGRCAYCKPCHRLRVRKWQTGSGKEAHSAASKRWNQGNGAANRRAITQRQRKKFPEKVTARAAVQAALRSGVLVRPTKCQECSNPCTPQGHHHDYGKPLEVRWLCPRCHTNTHRSMAPSAVEESK